MTGPYRGLPDIGQLISQGIHAMARGFAAIAEVAVAQATPPAPAPRWSGFQDGRRGVVLGADDEHVVRVLNQYLQEAITTRRPVRLLVRREAWSTSLTLTAWIDDAPYTEKVDEMALVASRNKFEPLLAAITRLADRINRDLR